MGNCGGRRFPDPKDVTLNYCGKFKDIPGGIGYLEELEEGEDGKIQSKNYCIPYGPLVTLGVISDVLIAVTAIAVAVLLPGIGELADAALLGEVAEGAAAGATAFSTTATVATGTAAVSTGFTFAELGAQIQEAADEKEYQDEIDKYCRSIGDKDENGNTSWVGLSNQLNECDSIDSDKKYCSSLFIQESGDDTCLANDINSYTEFMSHGCCHGQCTRNGKKPKCTRKKVGQSFVFPGKPVTCCLSDYRVNSIYDPDGSNPESCYEDPVTKQRSCHPKYRDLGHSSCQDVMEDYCLGKSNIPGVNNYLEMWLPESEVVINSELFINNDPINIPWQDVDDGYNFQGKGGTVGQRSVDIESTQTKKVKAPCLTAIARGIFAQNTQIKNWDDAINNDLLRGNVNPPGIVWAKKMVKNLYDTYSAEYGSFIGKINQDGYTKADQFKSVLGTICGNFPFLCQDLLKEACSDVTIDQFVYLPPDAKSWCGCFMKEDQYSKYTDLDIPLECTPTCSANGNVPLTDDTSFDVKICKDTLCVIDDVSINIANSQYPGGFNFNQLCNSCGSVDSVESTNQALIDDQLTSKSDTFVLETIISKESGFSDFNLITATYNSGNNSLSFNNFNFSDINIVKDRIIVNVGVYTSPPSNTSTPIKAFSYFLLNSDGTYSLKALQGNGKVDDSEKYVIGPATQDSSWNPSSYNELILTNDHISVSSSMRSITNLSSTIDSLASNTCNCIFTDSSLDVENSKIGSFNFNEKCGTTTCHDGQGNTIPCTSGRNDLSYQAISGVKDSMVSFKAEMIDNKNKFSLLIISTIFLVFTFLFIRIFNDDNYNKNTYFFSIGIYLLFLIFIIVEVIQAFKDEFDISEYIN